MSNCSATDKFPRYRTVHECYLAIKALDEDTAITECFIRRLCRSGHIVCYESGKKCLVNLDSLLVYLSFVENKKEED